MSWFSKRRTPSVAAELGARIEELANTYASELSHVRQTLLAEPLPSGETGTMSIALAGMLTFFADYAACDTFGIDSLGDFALEVKQSLLYSFCARQLRERGSADDYLVRSLIAKHGDRIVEMMQAANLRVASADGLAGAVTEACSFTTELLTHDAPKNDDAAKTLLRHSLTLFGAAIAEINTVVQKAAPPS
jgi:hypothetical protein